VYLTEEADGLPPALTTAPEGGTSLKVAGQRRGLRERLLDCPGCGRQLLSARQVAPAAQGLVGF
jgi:hypothetical protein